MKKSENLGLNLPEDDDFFDVEHQNENMRKLDENKTIVENNQITTVAGHAADARQLNKSIEGTFAYLINSDLARIKDELSISFVAGDVTRLIGKNKNYFVVNGINLPDKEQHGMLFCRYYNGLYFAPNEYQRAEPITKQIFMPYCNDNLYIRTYNHSTDTWTVWSKH